MIRKKFYVYVHKYCEGPNAGKVFYVGKGQGDRWTYEGSGRNPRWIRVVKKYNFLPEVVMLFDSEVCALSFERALISFYGRENLVNMTDGGEGVSGYNHTEESKEKMSGPRDNTNQWLRGKEMPSWLKIKLRNAKLGKKQSPEHAEKSRNAKLGKKVSDTSKLNVDKRIKIINDHGEVFESVNEAARVISERMGVNASQGNISMVLRGNRKTAYGHTWKYLDK